MPGLGRGSLSAHSPNRGSGGSRQLSDLHHRRQPTTRAANNKAATVQEVFAASFVLLVTRFP